MRIFFLAIVTGKSLCSPQSETKMQSLQKCHSILTITQLHLKSDSNGDVLQLWRTSNKIISSIQFMPSTPCFNNGWIASVSTHKWHNLKMISLLNFTGLFSNHKFFSLKCKLMYKVKLIALFITLAQVYQIVALSWSKQLLSNCIASRAGRSSKVVLKSELMVAAAK